VAATFLASAGHAHGSAGAHLHGGHGADDMALMVLLACAVSYAALDAGCRVRAAHGRARLAWLAAGSLVLGVAIWAMHFVALLSLKLPLPMKADPVTLIIAAVTAVIAAAGALYHVDRGVGGVPPLVVGAALKGFALVATHYTLVAAVHVPAQIHYHPGMLLVSAVIGIGVSGATLRLAERLRGERPLRAAVERVGAALVMGGGLTLLHHASVSAGHFVPDDVWREHAARGDHIHELAEAWLTPWVAGSTLTAVAVLALAATVSRWRRLREHTTPAQCRLTGLPNRALLHHRLAQALYEMRPCAVVAVRLDSYEHIVARHGRRTAEALLVGAGRRVQAAVRDCDLATRLDAAHYAVLVDDAAAAEVVVARIRAALSEPVTVGLLEVVVPAAVGAATALPGDGVEELLTRAQFAAGRVRPPAPAAPVHAVA
jgi:NO-binding membrane sensor protein with MHYT domain/GGDEF domain-containing protein